VDPDQDYSRMESFGAVGVAGLAGLVGLRRDRAYGIGVVYLEDRE
jgi:MYXO-CTERM domain-containing protein